MIATIPKRTPKTRCLQRRTIRGFIAAMQHSGHQPLFRSDSGSPHQFQVANLSIKPVSKGMDGYWWQGAHKEPR